MLCHEQYDSQRKSKLCVISDYFLESPENEINMIVNKETSKERSTLYECE